MFGNIAGNARFPRARRRDSMPAEGKPRTAMSTQTIIVERRGRVGIVRLNRPQALNALNVTLKDELLGAVEAFDADANVGCILMTGSDKAFAAGADIKEMADQTYIDIFRADYTADYERLARVRKPIIAAVAGVVPAASLMEEAMKVAETIAAMSQPSLLAAKEAVNRSFETSLAEGVRFERRVFHALFATKDRKEGMAAFIEKRPPRFVNE